MKIELQTKMLPYCNHTIISCDSKQVHFHEEGIYIKIQGYNLFYKYEWIDGIYKNTRHGFDPIWEAQSC